MKGPFKMIREEHQKLGSVFTMNLLHKKVTFLVGPEVSSHFFESTEADLSTQEVYKFNVPIFGPEVLYDVDYSVRLQQSAFFIEALRGTKLQNYADQMLAETEDYFSKWGDSGTVDLRHELEHVIILIVSRCLLGREVREKHVDEVAAAFDDLENGLCPISLISPYFPMPIHRRRDLARACMLQIFTKIIKSRRSCMKPEYDMLQYLIDSKYGDGRDTTEVEITGLLIALLFGVLNPSYTASIWTGAYLLKFNKFWSGAVEEQSNLIIKHGLRIDYDILSKMEVLYCCIKESLRLHPPVTLLLRHVNADFCVKTKEGVEYDIPKGHIVATLPVFANRLPCIYKDPDVYDPDRFVSGREEDKVAGEFSNLSFSGGRHLCPGESFAYLQIKVIWSHLLRNFELELVSPFPESDRDSIAVGVKGNLMVKYRRKLKYEI